MTTLARLGPAILENRCTSYGKVLVAMSRNSSESERGDSPSKKNRPMVTAAELDRSDGDNNEIIVNDVDEAPTNCCMSGCVNCVWIQYAELLSEKLKNSDEEVQKIIMDKVQDPNMRAFLTMELRCRNLAKS